MLGNFPQNFASSVFFFKINFSKKFFSVKRFGSRSGSKLFAKVISRVRFNYLKAESDMVQLNTHGHFNQPGKVTDQLSHCPEMTSIKVCFNKEAFIDLSSGRNHLSYCISRGKSFISKYFFSRKKIKNYLQLKFILGYFYILFVIFLENNTLPLIRKIF